MDEILVSYNVNILIYVQQTTFAYFYFNKSSVAAYYHQSGDTVDLIPTISSLIGVPCSILAAYFISRFGLKHGLYVGSIFTGVGM